jgi:hypothetical protein
MKMYIHTFILYNPMIFKLTLSEEKMFIEYCEGLFLGCFHKMSVVEGAATEPWPCEHAFVTKL